MVKFHDIVSAKISSCKKCYAVVYSLPCHIDKDIVKYFRNMGKPAYPLSVTRLLRINIKHGFYIEGTVGSKTIKFSMPKELENNSPSSIKENMIFVNNLSKWLSDKLNIQIEI